MLIEAWLETQILGPAAEDAVQRPCTVHVGNL